jgi:methylthioribose-1-phosphate isomerase
MIAQAIRWVGGVDGFLELIDQRQLPAELTKLQCRDIKQVFEAIQTLAVRGAPAIGVAAAYALALGMQKLAGSDNLEQAVRRLKECCEYLAQSRPTGVNLFWALDRVKRKALDFVAAEPSADLLTLQKVVLDEAHAICQEDIDMCRQIGKNGQKFIRQDSGILTHCNAGALATAGQGTALSVIFEAHKRGRKFKVYVDETRPLLQGARLTTWELKQAGIDCFLICDNAAGWLMKQGQINAVVTGADRIAANGDVANKVGTYSLAVLAKSSGVAFYVAAPSSTFDLSIKSGGQIPIEQRAAEEVTRFADTQIAPEGISVCNPAFDVTDASLITAIITEKGVIENPSVESVSKVLNG